MTYPELSDPVLEALAKNGFAGTDANLATSIFEYGGAWSKELGLALLCETESRNPGLEFQYISAEEIKKEVAAAGPGFLSYVDAANCGEPEGMSAIHALMQYNGGWHANSAQWRKLSQWEDPVELLRVLDHMQSLSLKKTQHP